MLQNSVNNIAEVHAVEQQVAQYKMQSGIDLTYLHYCNLLLLAAIEYDSQFYIKKSSKNSYQQLYEHDVSREDYIQMGYYNIDSDLDIIQANITECLNSQMEQHL